MNFNKLILVGLVSSWGLLGSAEGAACPAEIQNLKSDFLKQTTFCEIYEAYQTYKINLKPQDLDEQIKSDFRYADFVAPRFINRPDWIKNREIKKYDPVLVYEPAPLSWLSWERGQLFLKESVQWNRDQHQIAEISKDWIGKMHLEMMEHLTPHMGQVRNSEEYGLVIKKNVALTREKIKAIRSNPSQIYQWRPTICLEDQSPEVQKNNLKKLMKLKDFEVKTWPLVSENQFFKDENGLEKQCGIILYPNFNQVSPRLAKLILFTNKNIQDLSRTDLLLFLAHIQKEFVGIHPFADGNGRVSRNLVEYILLSLDLPPPIFENMDEDLYSTDAQWAKKIGEGMVRSLEILKKCQDQSELPECKKVPLHSSLKPSPLINWLHRLGFK